MIEIKEISDLDKSPVVKKQFISYESDVFAYMKAHNIRLLTALLMRFNVAGYVVQESKKSGGKRIIFSVKGRLLYIMHMTRVLKGQMINYENEQGQKRVGDFA